MTSPRCLNETEAGMLHSALSSVTRLMPADYI